MIRLAVPQIGGPEWRGGFNYLVNLCEALVRHGSDRITPVIFLRHDIADSDAGRLIAIPGVDLVRDAPFMAPAGRAGRLLQAMAAGRDQAAARSFRAAGADVILESFTFYGRRAGLPVLSWLPDFQHRHMPDQFSRRGWWRRELAIRAKIAAGRTLLLSSGDAAGDCARFYGVTADRLCIARFAVAPPTAEERAGADAAVARLGLAEPYAYLPNQLWRHKNHALVVDALALLAARQAAPLVVVTGHGDDPRAPGHRAALVERVRAGGLGDRFRMLGVVPHADVRALMIGARLLLNPSRFEGWSTTVEEARSAGVRMLLSDLPVHREQAGDQAAYFPVDRPDILADRLAAAMRQPAGTADDAAAWGRVRAFAAAVEQAVDHVIVGATA